MARFKNVNGTRIPFTTEEEVARDAEEAYNTDPQREIERELAEKDRLIARIAALPREDQLPILWHWRAEKAANPALTKAQFLQSLRDDLDQLAALFG